MALKQMSEKFRVIFCTDGLFPHAVGGMQRHSRLLIEALAEKGAELIVLHPHSENVFSGVENIREIQITAIDERKNYLRQCYQYSKRVYEVLLQYPEHLIYAQGLTVWFGVKEVGHRMIVNPHGLEPFQAFGLKNKIIAQPFIRTFKFIFKRARFVVSLGGRLTDILSQIVPGHRLVVLPNAVNSPSQTNSKSFSEAGEKVRLLFVARFAHNKGLHVLLRVIKSLNDSGDGDNLEFTLAGKGPLYEDTIRDFDFENVHYPGFVSDEELAQLYADANVFVFPTLFEGMPTVVLEAMAQQLPVIVSDTGATAELVDESNGYLIQKDSVNELRKAILSFVNSSAQIRQSMGRESLEKVKERFTWDKVAQSHIEVFKELQAELLS